MNHRPNRRRAFVAAAIAALIAASASARDFRSADVHAGISIGEATRTAHPYHLAIWTAINLVTYVAVFSTWLPSLITGHPVF